jgi:hypothetical protein
MSQNKYQLIWMAEIIELLSKQEPARTEVIKSLQKSFGGKWTSSGYFRIVSAQNANNAGSEWQFLESIILKDESLGIIILDVLKGERVGGIEFFNLVSEENE